VPLQQLLLKSLVIKAVPTQVNVPTGITVSKTAAEPQGILTVRSVLVSLKLLTPTLSKHVMCHVRLIKSVLLTYAVITALADWPPIQVAPVVLLAT